MSRPARIHVALRYDDFCATTPTDLEARMLEACARHRVPMTFGVIPEVAAPGPGGEWVAHPLPDAKLALLREGVGSGILEVALHGLTHRSHRADSKTEFAGLPRGEQEARLRRGKALLEREGLLVRSFIPPWNAYDAATLEAMAAVGLRVLSADGRGPAAPASALRFVPATCLFTELRRAVAQARAVLERGYPGDLAVVLYPHPYEFLESGSPRVVYPFSRFEAEVGWLASQEDVSTGAVSDLGALDAAAPDRFAGYSRPMRRAPEWAERALRPGFRVYPAPGFAGILGGVRLSALAGASSLTGKVARALAGPARRVRCGWTARPPQAPPP